jgi:hypothetical protein
MREAQFKIYVTAAIVAGALAAVASAFAWQTGDPGKLAGYLILTWFASTIKMRIPALTGSVSLGFVAVLTGVAVMSLSETVLGVTGAAIAQTLWRPKQRPMRIQVAFNVSVLAASTWIAYTLAHAVAPSSPVLRVAAAVVPLYLFNTGAVAGVLSILSGSGLDVIWDKFLFAAFPCYVMGAVLAALLAEANLVSAGWFPVLAAAGLSYVMFNSYRNWLSRFA